MFFFLCVEKGGEGGGGGYMVIAIGSGGLEPIYSDFSACITLCSMLISGYTACWTGVLDTKINIIILPYIS